MDYSSRNKKVALARWKKVHSQFNVNNKITLEKIAIFAYLSGDGNIDMREKDFRYDIKFFFDDLFLAKRVVGLFNREYNLEPKIEHVKSKIEFGNGYFKVRTSCKPVCLNLLSFGKYGKLDWRVPENLSKKMIKEWIKCFFDCEAYVNLHKKQIQVKSVNGEGLKQVLSSLNVLGIKTKLYGPYFNGKGHNDYYLLTILSKEDLKRYKRLIGFYHRKKEMDLIELCR